MKKVFTIKHVFVVNFASFLVPRGIELGGGWAVYFLLSKSCNLFSISPMENKAVYFLLFTGMCLASVSK